MFEVEKIVISTEYEELVKEILDKHEKEIQVLLEDASKRLGEGRTADVCFLESNNKICLKIFKKSEQITEVQFYLPPAQEKVFLESLKNLDSRARVPKVYASFEDKDEEGHNFLMMETLPAMSVADVLQGKEKLPENFNVASFQSDLLDFIEKMHQRNTYHRDLHEGNIMIDRETAQVYVIDFGAAAEFWGEPEPGERGPYNVMKDGRDITLTSDESMIRLVVKKLRTKLTNSN